MKEVIEEIKAAYVASGRAFSHDPMPFDDRMEAMNKWWAAVTPEWEKVGGSKENARRWQYGLEACIEEGWNR
ncbi:hypothetical protein [Yersinia enterocolitica]|uniref:hypothetical protein n=1 Tax=Yersinia enterocolitica TaxID=630 RepID=UPI0005DC35ED|nr:hypothetical protein [Yersinia enterocolitica]CNI79246.1 Uncharacterised protein [Yersinia enterocolitica]